MTKPFVHLHVHTEFSMLDGLGSVSTPKGLPDRIGYVDRAKALGMPALAITDHGNLCGAPSFYHACRKAEIEPIIGQEFYFVEDVAWRKKKGGTEQDRHHVVMLAKGERGYKVLAELSSEAHRNFYSKPIVDHNILEQLGRDAEHLVVLSGCASSIISVALLKDDLDKAHEETLWWRETFPHFYMELQHHNTEFDRKLNKGLLGLSKRYDIPHVITNDPHYVVEEDAEHHDALLAIQTASNLDDPERFRFDGSGYHLRDRAEMRRAFKKYGDEVWLPGAKATMEIAKLCKTRIPSWETRTWQIPNYPKLPAGKDVFKYMRKIARRNMERRGHSDRPEYVERLEYELNVFKEVGISNFMLITRDIIKEAQKLGVRVGPGRGSVCGSLAAYYLEIHKIDPIKYGLRFDRFLNPARPRMPDIDTDLAQSGRDLLFKYVMKQYGEENVVHVAAYAHMQVKAAFQQLARVHGISFAEALRISKTLSDDAEGDYDLPETITSGYPEFAVQLRRLAGVKRSISNHPAGVVIASPEAKLREQVPTMWIASSKRTVGQFDLDAIEELGLLKEDLLGLRTLDTIDWAVKFIKDLRGEDLEPDDWVPDEEPDDRKIWKMLSKGRTAGVFQMEGPTNQRGIRDIKPKLFEDVVSCTALYRTGAISAGFPKIFLENRRSGQIDFIHPGLEPILGTTGGVVLYQEQVMDMAEHLAGFDMVQVDDIKEAIKHKKSTLMEEMMVKFIKGCIEHSGMTKTQAKECARYIQGYAGYGYNRSHAVAYTVSTYQTARLKCLYPHEFWAAHLHTVDLSTKEGKAKRDVYLREAIDDGFEILAPDVNLSDDRARPEGESGIRFGFADYAGIGDKTAQRLLAARQAAGGRFSSLAEVKAACTAKGYDILARGGALQEFGIEGSMDDTETLLSWQFRDGMKKWRKRYRHLVDLPNAATEDEMVTLVGEVYKITKAKTKNGKDYMTWKVRWSVTESFDVRLWSETSKYWELGVGSVVMVQGTWEPKWMNVSVGNSRMIQVLKEVAA